MAKVIRKDGETIDQLYQRFKSQCYRDEIIKGARARTAYKKPGDKRRDKHHNAIVKRRRALRLRRSGGSEMLLSCSSTS